MGFDRITENHNCMLAKTQRQLFPLRPNASLLKKLFRKIRLLVLLNRNNKNAKEFFMNRAAVLAEQKRQVETCYPFIIHPFSQFKLCVDLAFVAMWFWAYLTIPLYGIPAPWAHPFGVLNKFLMTARIMVIFFFYITGYVNYKRKMVILDPRMIIRHYFATYGVFDHLSVVGGIYLDVRESPSDHFTYFVVNSFILSTMLVRFKYFLNTLNTVLARFGVKRAARYLITNILLLFIILHLFTIFAYSVPLAVYGGDFPEESWVRQANIHKFNVVPMENIYFESQLIALCYFFGATYDKHSIIMPNEKLTLALFALIGRILTLYCISSVLKMFGLVNISESKYEQFMSELNQYMNSKQLPENLKIRLVTYYEYKLQRHYFNETEIYNTLSNTLRTEMFLFGARRLVEKAVILKGLPSNAIGVMMATMKSELFLPGDIIARADTYSETFYLISWGTVAVYKDTYEIDHLCDGEEFGMLVSKGNNHLYTYKAVEISDIYYCDAAALKEILRQYPQVVKFFRTRKEKKMERYRHIEEHLGKGNTVFEQLQARTLLERRELKYLQEFAN